MYSKWIKSGFILAMLLISMVSLSMAACPWFIKNEFYTAQCGVLKEIPASKGLLANDPGATAILDPASITIDPKYGTLVVQSSGAFVYDPNPDMKSGTYVTIKYTATNGVCAAKYAGTAKIQVSCKCRPNVKDITLRLTQTTTLDEIKQKLIEAGVDCIGCGASPTVLDLRSIKLAPGRYRYLLNCPGCQNAVGWVTLVSGCTARAPPLEFCAGSVRMADLPGLIQAECVGVGCGQPDMDYRNVTVVNGFVSGGYYVAICNPATEGGSWARGNITVFPKCVVNAPPIEICEEKTLGELEDAIEAEGPGCTGVGCDATPVLSYENVIVDEETGFVTGGSYTVTCTTSKDCVSSANGAITVVPKCEVVVQGLQGACFTPAQLQENITALNPAPCGTCDSTPVFDFPVWDLDEFGNVAAGIYEFTITCDAGPNDCKSEGIGVAIIEGCLQPECSCIAEAEDVEVCAGEVTLDDLKDIILAGNAICTSLPGFDTCDTTPEIDLTKVTVSKNGYVTGGSYDAICQPTLDCEEVRDTGTVTAVPCCKCEAVAPNLCFDIVCLGSQCRTYSYDAILKEVIAKGGAGDAACSEMTLKFFQDGKEIDYKDLVWKDPVDYKYKVVCKNSDGTCTAQSEMGDIDVSYYCGCP